MLRFREELSVGVRGVSVEVDAYVPITVNFGAEVLERKLYWRAKCGLSSLLEVGFIERNGELLSFTLTSIARESVKVCEVTPCPAIDKESLPYADLSIWPGSEGARSYRDTFVDEECKLALYLNENSAWLEVGEYGRGERFVGLGPVRIGLDRQRGLCSVGVCDLSDADRALLRELLPDG